MQNLNKVKSALIQALVVIVAMQLILAVASPLIPFITFGVVFMTIGGVIYYRRTRL